jgi:hypothetical protein
MKNLHSDRHPNRISNLRPPEYKVKIQPAVRCQISWRLCVNNTGIDFLDIMHRPVFIGNNVMETGLCLRPQGEACSVWPSR